MSTRINRGDWITATNAYGAELRGQAVTATEGWGGTALVDIALNPSTSVQINVNFWDVKIERSNLIGLEAS